MKNYFKKLSIWDGIFVITFIVLGRICWGFYNGFSDLNLNVLGLLIEMTVGFFIVEVVAMLKSKVLSNQIIGFITLLACIFAFGISTSSIVSSYMNSSVNIQESKKKEIKNDKYTTLQTQESTCKQSLTRLTEEKTALENGMQPAIDEQPSNYLTVRGNIRKEYEKNILAKSKEISGKEAELLNIQNEMKNTPKTVIKVSQKVEGNEIFIKIVANLAHMKQDAVMMAMAIIVALIIQVFYFVSKYNATMARKKKEGKIEYTVDYIVNKFTENQNKQMVELMNKQLNNINGKPLLDFPITHAGREIPEMQLPKPSINTIEVPQPHAGRGFELSPLKGKFFKQKKPIENAQSHAGRNSAVLAASYDVNPKELMEYSSYMYENAKGIDSPGRDQFVKETSLSRKDYERIKGYLETRGIIKTVGEGSQKKTIILKEKGTWKWIRTLKQ